MEQKTDTPKADTKIFTIPIILSFFRLCLIPLIIWLYCVEHNYLWAGNVLILSGLTDLVDGFIARKFKQIQKSTSIHNESETFIVYSDCMAYYKWLVLYFAWGRNLFRYWLDDYGCGCIYRIPLASNLPGKDCHICNRACFAEIVVPKRSENTCRFGKSI